MNEQFDDLTPPEFKSNVPEVLINGLSDVDRYVVEQLSILNQKNDWQTSKIAEQAIVLKEVAKQTQKTNGRVTQLEDKSQNFDKRLSEDKEVIDTAKKIVKMLSNKYILIAILASFVIFWHLIALVPVGAAIKLLTGAMIGS